jgi:hypothetical protein
LDAAGVVLQVHAREERQVRRVDEACAAGVVGVSSLRRVIADSRFEPEHFGRLCISRLQGLLLQVGVYGDAIDIDAYARATTTLIDGQPVE